MKTPSDRNDAGERIGRMVTAGKLPLHAASMAAAEVTPSIGTVVDGADPQRGDVDHDDALLMDVPPPNAAKD